MSHPFKALLGGNAPVDVHQYPMTTSELARELCMKPESIRVRLCRLGHFYGLHPKKLPNGRLIWPPDSKERLLGSAMGDE